MSFVPDNTSEAGDDMFRGPAAALGTSEQTTPRGTGAPVGGSSGERSGLHGRKGVSAVETADTSSGQGWGRGPMVIDHRKYRFDVRRAKAGPGLSFSASKADRMDAEDAGDLLHRLHVAFGIDRETEDRIYAFNCALFIEHTLNGASLLQPGRGTLKAGGMSFDVQVVKSVLGVDQRRFFRAYADDITDVNRRVIREFDPMDPESAEVHGQMQQIAVERGLIKYPYLIHDSADAGILLSNDERQALVASKRFVLLSTVNNVDRVGSASEARENRETAVA